MSTLLLKDGQRIVFVGDSTTDYGRREEYAPHGNSYVPIVRGWVMAQAPQLQIEYFNRGTDGDTTIRLQDRWQEDVIELKPDWLSVLVGINDCYQYIFHGRAELGPGPYAKRYESLLAQAVDQTGCSLILLEPFYFTRPPGVDEKQREAFRALPEYIAAVHNLAQQFGARLIRTHQIGQEIVRHQGSDALCPEPVHPWPTGHAVIAHAIWQTLNSGD